MNLSNGGRIAQKSDGTIYYFTNGKERTGIFELTSAKEERNILSKPVIAMYVDGDKLYYVTYNEGALYELNLSTNSTTPIWDGKVGSFACAEDKIYFLASSSSDSTLKLYTYTNEPQVIETTGIPADTKLRYLYEADDKLYIVGDNCVYCLNEDAEAELFLDAPEQLHKFFKLGQSSYAVGNYMINRLMSNGTLSSIAPQYIGISPAVTILNDSVIYSGLGGTYEYNDSTEKTKKISNNIYQEIYIVNNKLIGITPFGEEREFEEIV